MTYTYHCKQCDHTFELFNVSHTNRDAACREACPQCKEVGHVEKIIEMPAMSYQGAMSTTRRAGSEWNSLLKRIKKRCSKRIPNSIHHD